jgi:hypothetical protein
MTCDPFCPERRKLRNLLVKYIKHVVACEGVDFILHGINSNEVDFSYEEWNLLETLADEAKRE